MQALIFRLSCRHLFIPLLFSFSLSLPAIDICPYFCPNENLPTGTELINTLEKNRDALDDDPRGLFFFDTIPPGKGKGKRTKVKKLSARITGDDVDIDWITVEEHDVDYFELYAAIDAQPYKSIEKIKPDKGKIKEKEEKEYKLKDKESKKKNKEAKRIYYRLHEVTKKGEDHILAVAMTASASSSGNSNAPDQLLDLLPQTTPKSPEVAAMERFDQYPVSHFTGIADISIPIHTIEVGALKIPIELKYHSGGNKVSDVAPRQGLGWSITGLYSLSAEIRGQADQTSSTGMLNNDLPTFTLSCITPADKQLLDGHINFGYDMERDVFTYRTPLRTNSFVVTPDSTYFLEADRSLINYSGGFNDFTLLDDHGNQYYYDIKENTGGNNINNTSAWHVSEILTSVSGEKVSYTYYNLETLSYITDHTTVHTVHTDLCDNVPAGITSGPQPPTYLQNTVYISQRPLKEIFFPGGKIHFVLESQDRQDLSGAKALDKIDVYSYDFEEAGTNKYKLIRSYDLSYVYKTRSGTNGGKVLFLEKVEQKDNGGVVIGTYKMDYNTTALPKKDSYATDEQGYYNGATNANLIPAYSIPYAPNCNSTNSTATNANPANRNSNGTYMDAWMLERIDYPTGGYTKFEYEPHKYIDGSTTTLAGGLRIKKMTSYSGSGALLKSFRYGASESGHGTYRDYSKVMMRTDQMIKKEDNTGGSDYYSYNVMRLSSGVNTLINAFEGVPVTYGEVTVYEDSTGAGSIGKTIYTYKNDVNDLTITGNGATNRQVLQSRHWARGQLLSRKVYGSDNNLKEEITNTYTAIIPSNPTPALGYVLGRSLDMITLGVTNGSGCLIDDDQFILNPYSWYPGLLKLNTTRSRKYDDITPGKYVDRLITQSYDPDDYQLTEEKYTNTDGDERIKRYRYVTGLSNLSASHTGASLAFFHMRENNQLNTPIEINTLRKSGSTTRYLSGLLSEYSIKQLDGRYYVLPANIYQARIDDLNQPTSFTQVNVSSGGTISRDASYVHRLDFIDYTTHGKIDRWKRPGNSIIKYTWDTDANSTYHHRMQNSILHHGNTAAQITQYKISRSLLGMDTLIIPNGISTTYNYDSYGRFKRILDNAGDIDQENEYVISSGGNSRVIIHTPRSSMSILSTDITEVMTDIHFYDGLGRAEQTMQKQASPNASTHIVRGAVTRDDFGRTSRDYVPFSAGGSTTQKASLPTSVHGDNKPYGEVKTYDDSPLLKPKEILGLGSTWHSQNKFVENTYEVAPGSTIRKYVNGISGATVSGTYGTNELYMRKTISEQGNVTIAYLDNDGKIVQRSEQDSTGTYRHTAFIYNNHDRVRFVIQPQSFETSQSFTIDDGYFKDGVFEFVYDSLGREISRHTPGGGRSFTVHDRLDRTVLTQTALQKANNKWSYIRYDAFGRVAHTGELTSSLSQSALADKFKAINQCYEQWVAGSWTTVSFPSELNSASKKIKVDNIYDSYTAWNSLAPFDSDHAYHNAISDATGLLTGSFSYNSDDANESYFDVVYYDYKLREIQRITSHHLAASPASPQKIITSLEYNHAGDILRTKTTWQFEDRDDITHIDSTIYDHRSRPVSYASGVDVAAEVICTSAYDVTGRLNQKVYQPGGSYTKGGTNDYIFRPPSPTETNTADTARVAIILDAGTTIDVNSINTYMAVIDTTSDPGTTINALQTIQYSYNIRDWLTGINLNAEGNPVPNVSEGDLFSMKMNYASAGRYDGTMGSQAWAHHNEDLQQRSYTFSYDAASRIKGATYSGVNGENYSVSDLRYDKTGNIKRLKRMGKKGSGYAQIDDLSYTYSGNHLMRVEDAVSGDNEVDFVNRNSGSDDYAYYADGCLQKDLNENISNIDYDTYLNKPVRVTLSTGETIKYIYDGTGTMIRRELSDGTSWDYLGGMILKDGNPYQIAMAEGRIVYEDTVPRHEYEYRDQVGNLRVSFTERNGKLQQTYAAGYSPFGVQIHAEVSTPAPCKFTYQNHEDIGDFGLRMVGMGARCYNESIGRFIAVDHRAEKYPGWSPYNYVLGNPIRNIDPQGDTVQVAVGNEFINYTPGMEYTGDNKFAQGVFNSLNTMNTSEAGAEVLGSLVASKNNYSFVNVVSTDKNGNPVEGVRFRRGENGGGTIEAGSSSDVGTIAHELFHGYQIESGMNPATTAGEVGAYLFQDVVNYQSGVMFGSNVSTNKYGLKYDDAHKNLVFNGFNDADYVSANIFFKYSSKNATGLYNKTKRQFSLFPKPPVAKFLPAFK